MQINAFAADKPKANLKPFTYSAPIREDDVLIKISHCALGTPDVFFIDNFWGNTQFPLIPGYEIIGEVEIIGKKVKNLKIKNRVGIGYQTNSCGQCEYCLAGQENLCSQQEFIGVNHFGGLADKIIVNNRFAFKIPNSLDPAKTAPLMCSGLTVYAAIKNAGVKKDMNVGVIGIGGLGHLAVKILNKMGCKVTAFSSHQGKNLEKLNFDNFVDSTNQIALKKLERSFDYLLSTAYVDLDWNQYIKLLKPQGILSIVGLPPKEIHFSAGLLADYAQRTIKGGFIGNRKQMKDLLTFAAKHKIEAETEVFSINQVNEVLDKIRRKEILFKAVIEL